jgi:hypothetical protein
VPALDARRRCPKVIRYAISVHINRTVSFTFFLGVASGWLTDYSLCYLWEDQLQGQICGAYRLWAEVLAQVRCFGSRHGPENQFHDGLLDDEACRQDQGL